MDFKSIVNKYWPLLIILFLGGCLRLFGLLQNPISLFSDEVDMGYQAYSLIKTGCDYSGHCLPVQFYSFSDVQPPIPIYLIALFAIFGVNLELAIRLVPAIFGTLGILTTYFLVENLKSKKIFNIDMPNLGLISAGILAIIPWHFTYSRIGFSLALLYFFATLGFYFFTQYLIKEKNIYLFLSVIFLGLTPMVYNTAKMAILFYPFVLFLVPGTYEIFKKNTYFKLSLVAMFIPLCLLFAGGGTSARFDYISIFTDPTAPSEVNYQRLIDLGPSAAVGSSPSISTKFFHNKPFWFGEKFLNNIFGLISTDYLFINGDPNIRHSPKDWGMIYRSTILVLFIGVYFLIRFSHKRLLMFLVLFTVISMSTSAITRDGASHASRSFMMIFPIVFISGLGLAYALSKKKVLFYFLACLIATESMFFIHNYWYHYRLLSERSWSAGMKEMVESTKKYPNQPIVISPKYEHPLIFWLYYTRYDPKKFQEIVKSQTLYNSTSGNHNLEGNRIGDTNLYIATLIELNRKPVNRLPGAVYFLTQSEIETSSIGYVATISGIIRLPSGNPLYYEIYY